MLEYSKLWLLLNERGMKRTDLLKEPVKLSSATLAKLGKNDHVSTASIEKICDFLECQPGDIMSNVTENDVLNISASFENAFNSLLQKTSVVLGEESKDQLLKSFKSDPILNKYIDGDKFDLQKAVLDEFISKKREKD